MSHEKKTRRLSRELERAKQSIGLNKATSNLFRHRRKTNKSRLDVRDFNQVLSIDRKNAVCHVEGMTTYEDLVKETLRHGLLPTVVPELKSITVGGAISGIGIESSSFRYGLVHETVREMEILLSDGRIVKATPTNTYRDLFFALPNSYGTLGYLLSVKITLIKAKPYVKLVHTRFSDPQQYFNRIKELCSHNAVIDYIDGTIFGPSEMLITTGTFVDQAPFVSNYTGNRIYYRSIQKKDVDYMTAHDYIWRWDTDWFWCSSHFGVQNKVVRALVPKRWLGSRTYWKIRAWSARHPWLFAFSRKKESIVQDVEIPISRAADFMAFFHSEIGISPIWACPIHPLSQTWTLYPMKQDTLYVNFGFWDTIATDKPAGYYNKKIEREVRKLGGKKSLYSTVFYSKGVFDKLYNGVAYRRLKKKYDPQSRLGLLYDKCVQRK